MKNIILNIITIIVGIIFVCISIAYISWVYGYINDLNMPDTFLNTLFTILAYILPTLILMGVGFILIIKALFIIIDD
jgi:hypothetical protein